MNKVPDSNKIEDDIEKRIPDDEGLYMGDPVKLGNGNWNRLYWRLLKQNAKYSIFYIFTTTGIIPLYS